MSRRRPGRHERIECRHRNKRKRVTQTAGLRHVVCLKCGHVNVDYGYDVYAEEKQQLEFGI